jgi:prepilin-type N-terminal cleavage/methylation domain-containing protein
MSSRGFTLIELMVVVMIAVVVTVLGYMSISSRMRVARLEEAAQVLTSDLTYTRSAAMLKGCRSRIILCPDRTCLGISGAVANVDTDRFYAIMRQSSEMGTGPCESAAAVPAADDGFTNWDFDRRPSGLPQGVRFVDVYTAGLNVQNWDTAATSAAGNSLYFRTDGSFVAPATAQMLVPGSTLNHTILFQVTLDDCNPALESEDCPAYFIGIPAAGGTARFAKCSAGTRLAGTDPSLVCFATP